MWSRRYDCSMTKRNVCTDWIIFVEWYIVLKKHTSELDTRGLRWKVEVIERSFLKLTNLTLMSCMKGSRALIWMNEKALTGNRIWVLCHLLSDTCATVLMNTNVQQMITRKNDRLEFPRFQNNSLNCFWCLSPAYATLRYRYWRHLRRTRFLVKTRVYNSCKNLDISLIRWICISFHRTDVWLVLKCKIKLYGR